MRPLAKFDYRLHAILLVSVIAFLPAGLHAQTVADRFRAALDRSTARIARTVDPDARDRDVRVAQATARLAFDPTTTLSDLDLSDVTGTSFDAGRDEVRFRMSSGAEIRLERTEAGMRVTKQEGSRLSVDSTFLARPEWEELTADMGAALPVAVGADWLASTGRALRTAKDLGRELVQESPELRSLLADRDPFESDADYASRRNEAADALSALEAETTGTICRARATVLERLYTIPGDLTLLDYDPNDQTYEIMVGADIGANTRYEATVAVAMQNDVARRLSQGLSEAEVTVYVALSEFAAPVPVGATIASVGDPLVSLPLEDGLPFDWGLPQQAGRAVSAGFRPGSGFEALVQSTNAGVHVVDLVTDSVGLRTRVSSAPYHDTPRFDRSGRFVVVDTDGVRAGDVAAQVYDLGDGAPAGGGHAEGTDERRRAPSRRVIGEIGNWVAWGKSSYGGPEVVVRRLRSGDEFSLVGGAEWSDAGDRSPSVFPAPDDQLLILVGGNGELFDLSGTTPRRIRVIPIGSGSFKNGATDYSRSRMYLRASNGTVAVVDVSAGRATRFTLPGTGSEIHLSQHGDVLWTDRALYDPLADHLIQSLPAEARAAVVTPDNRFVIYRLSSNRWRIVATLLPRSPAAGC